VLLRRRLSAAGRTLLKLLTSGKNKLSLRELARRTKLSPSYLSIVRSGQQRISIGAYLALWKIVEEQRQQTLRPRKKRNGS
jgi:transcriptional regulator with XRE-family HTH domain